MKNNEKLDRSDANRIEVRHEQDYLVNEMVADLVREGGHTETSAQVAVDTWYELAGLEKNVDEDLSGTLAVMVEDLGVALDEVDDISEKVAHIVELIHYIGNGKSEEMVAITSLVADIVGTYKE